MSGREAKGAENNETDCDNPISLDEIEKGLWLGSFTAATDIETLKQRNVTHILTLDICPLPVHITELPFLKTKYVHVSDTPKDDLLCHFEECFSFLDDALSNDKVVLVHCYYGVSRSATIVIAYVMRKYQLSLTPAFERVKSKRRFVGPNSGFTVQLRLFHKMGWRIDQSHEKFKLYRLRMAADKVRKAKILPQNFMDLIKPDPGIQQSKPEPIVYRCRKCRRIVAAKSNLITHTPTTAEIEPKPAGTKHVTFQADIHVPSESSSDESKIGTKGLLDRMNALCMYSNSEKSSGCEPEPRRCKEILFIEPLAWMLDIGKQTQGKLNCPKCQSKLGNFSWVNSVNCPCGKNVSPAFYLVPSKVELTHSVQNVEITI
ncbi:dual specificity protein phosphatase MPK-4 [Sitodiplosis mosellana]|uniref:dual specificity protein phosphatase MPK-4 n=1 Tax=Sitodiplosis mosellana TaxID=263140 RepID=UPI0024450ED4|nr:dual specificity protein phosphatase MPK-4 [Sitodiplosis mosellana]